MIRADLESSSLMSTDEKTNSSIERTPEGVLVELTYQGIPQPFDSEYNSICRYKTKRVKITTKKQTRFREVEIYDTSRPNVISIR